MKVIEADAVNRILNFPELIATLRHAFGKPAGTPRRTLYHLAENDPFHDVFAVLPAWNDVVIGVKAFTYLPSNTPKGHPVLNSKVLLFSREDGKPLALVDGGPVTQWRTAAIAGLAADFLARKDARRLLICGTGKLSPFMTLAHASVRDYDEIVIWGRRPETAADVIAAVKAKRPELNVRAAGSLEAEVRAAHVIGCATGSKEPLFPGAWVQPGTHTDFFGNHERKFRECDSDLVAKAKVYVDSRDNTMNEAGELLVPIEEGRITASHILAELSQLCNGTVPGRQSDQDITLFKSVGTALSDLATAHLVTERS